MANPILARVLAGAAGGPGVPGAPGMMPPGAAGPAAGGADATGQMAMAALDQLSPREASGKASVERVKRALELAQKLIIAALPQVGQWNAQMAKDLHVIGRQLADARINLTKEAEPGPPPEAMIAGIGNTGLPGGF